MDRVVWRVGKGTVFKGDSMYSVTSLPKQFEHVTELDYCPDLGVAIIRFACDRLLDATREQAEVMHSMLENTESYKCISQPHSQTPT
jgi:hypothetical protein